jgi:hypothetical protein
MSQTPVHVPPPAPELARKAAIVGIGETDYHLDYKAARAKAPGYEAPNPEDLAKLAFERALEDSGLKRSDIDGLEVSFTYGGPSPTQMARILDLEPRHLAHNAWGIMAGPLPHAVVAIAEGRADTIAMVYAVASRAMGRQYGGETYKDAAEATPVSYYYYLPWGWSSQAAHWGLAFNHYRSQYGGVGEDDLGHVAVQLRKHASMNDNAVMQTPITFEEYQASRYIVKPLRLLDLCLVNDGGMCIIVRRADKAKDMKHRPVLVSGWGEASIHDDKLHHLVKERLYDPISRAGQQTLDMAGLSLSDIQHFEGYDAATMHLLSQVEGFGFAERGAGLDYFKNGNADFAAGKVAINTGGGMLSGSYMHGWNQVAEVTRQLRHEAGARQIKDVQASFYAMTQTDISHPMIFQRGA